MRLTSLFLLQGFLGLHLCSGFSVRPPTSPRGQQTRSTASVTALSSAMGEQAEGEVMVKTYPPPNAVPDGMKTYEVSRQMVEYL